MGLTLHYTLRASLRGHLQARRLVEDLRQAAADLPFDSVGPLVEYRAEPGVAPDAPGGFLDAGLAGCPSRLFGFRVDPARGSETAEFGLARYPGRPGWSWQSFCKTQYASAPQCGGLENFLRCHLSLIALLDRSAQLGAEVEVVDESGYWERRDRAELTREIAKWNEFIAAIAGKFKDALGPGLEGPIFQYPDFEHLEARGTRRRKK